MTNKICHIYIHIYMPTNDLFIICSRYLVHYNNGCSNGKHREGDVCYDS